MRNVIEAIQQHAAAIKNGEHDKIGPGRPTNMSPALMNGEAVAQGDLILIVRSEVPEGYQEVESPTELDQQLVPGDTTGARHCLDSLDGVTLYRPKSWGTDKWSLRGPYMRLTHDRAVMHPTHGAVHIPAGMSVECRYAREFDLEQAAARRAAD